MDFDEYEYLEKTVENPHLETEAGNGGGDEKAKTEVKERSRSSRHRSDEKKDEDEDGRHSKRSRSNHRSRSRDREEHRDKERDRDREKSRDKEERNGKERERDKDKDRDSKGRDHEKDRERDRSPRSRSRSERHQSQEREKSLEIETKERDTKDRDRDRRYVEFYDTMSVPMAIALSGQTLLGQPVMVKPSDAEKNLVQSTTAAAGAGGSLGPYSGGARRLYVGNLHVNMSEDDLRKVFEPFGSVELVQVPRDETGQCKGFGFVQFARLEDARNALNLNGQLEIAGRAIKVSAVTDQTEVPEGGQMQNTGDLDDDDGAGLSLNAQSEVDVTQLTGRKKKLFELRLKMNEARKSNQTDVGSEKKKMEAPTETKGISKQKWLEERKKKIGKLLDANGLDMTKAYMLDTQEAAETKYKKWEKEPTPSGWDVFNQKTLYNAYKKRTKNVQVDLEEYNRMRAADPEFYREASSLQYGKAPKTSKDKIDKMAQELHDREQKRQEFSRRRKFREEKDIDSINDRNEHFNKKIERAFGKYTLEIKNNLERGTALPD